MSMYKYLKQDRIAEMVDNEYTEQKLIQMVKSLNWEGNGTENNPYVVESPDGFTQKFRISNTKVFYLFKNLNFEFVAFQTCHNISLVNCSFKTLILGSCTNFKISSSSFSSLAVERSRKNHFIECKIENIISFLFSRRNIFEHCQMDKDTQNIITKGSVDITPLTKFIPFILLMGGFFIVFSIWDSIFFSKPLGIQGILILIMGGFLFVLILIFWISKITSKNRPINQIL